MKLLLASASAFLLISQPVVAMSSNNDQNQAEIPPAQTVPIRPVTAVSPRSQTEGLAGLRGAFTGTRSIFGESSTPQQNPSPTAARATVTSTHTLGSEEFVRQGTVFTSYSTVFVRKLDECGREMTSPRTNNALSAGTVEFLSPGAILYFKYYEKQPHRSIQSFWVTPNPGLTETSNDLSSLPTQMNKVYAALPVTIKEDDSDIELLVYHEGEAPSRADYASTVGAALETLLTRYIPTLQNRLPHLRTVTIADGNVAIGRWLTTRFPQVSQEQNGPYWRMIFNLRSSTATGNPAEGNFS